MNDPIRKKIAMLTLAGMILSSTSPTYAGFGGADMHKQPPPQQVQRDTGGSESGGSGFGFGSILGAAKGAITKVGGVVADGAKAAGGAIGSATGGVLGGDPRFKWTEENQQNAVYAKSVFEGKAVTPAVVNDGLPVIDPANPAEVDRIINRANAVSKKYKGSSWDNLSFDQKKEITDAMMPLIRYQEMSKRLKAQSEAKGLQRQILMPPKSAALLKFKGYCSDRQWPAPNSDDGLTFRSAEFLIDPEIRPLHDALMAYAYENPRDSYVVQRLVWQIRHQCHGNDTGRLTLSDQDLDLLDSIYPDGANVLAGYCANQIDFGGSLQTVTNLIPMPSGANELISGARQLKQTAETASEIAQQLQGGPMTIDKAGNIANSMSSLGFLPRNSALNDARQVMRNMDAVYRDGQEIYGAVVPETRSDNETYNEMAELLTRQPTGKRKQPLSGFSTHDDVVFSDTGTGRLNREVAVANPSKTPKIINIPDISMAGDREAQGVLSPGAEVISMDGSGINYQDEATLSKVGKVLDQVEKYIDAKQAWAAGYEYDPATGMLTRVSNSKAKTVALDAFYISNNNVPIWGSMLSFYEATANENWLTGQPLTEGERMIAALGAIPFARNAFNVGVYTGKSVIKGGRAAVNAAGNAKQKLLNTVGDSGLVNRHAPGIADAARSAGEAMKVADSVSKFAKKNSGSRSVFKDASGTPHIMASVDDVSGKTWTVVMSGYNVVNGTTVGEIHNEESLPPQMREFFKEVKF